jgi:hypothetical protein
MAQSDGAGVAGIGACRGYRSGGTNSEGAGVTGQRATGEPGLPVGGHWGGAVGGCRLRGLWGGAVGGRQLGRR